MCCAEPRLNLPVLPDPRKRETAVNQACCPAYRGIISAECSTGPVGDRPQVSRPPASLFRPFALSCDGRDPPLAPGAFSGHFKSCQNPGSGHVDAIQEGLKHKNSSDGQKSLYIIRWVLVSWDLTYLFPLWSGWNWHLVSFLPDRLSRLQRAITLSLSR